MKFSIVTPSCNSSRYLRQTIESVLTQTGDFDIEYILADGGSTDDTLAIWREAKRDNNDPRTTMLQFSERDRGMYDAINKGFARATGDVFAWLNSYDLYFLGALGAVAKVFTAHPDVLWLTGRGSLINENKGNSRSYNPLIHYKREWIRRGFYGRYAPFIQQDAVFWRRSLWDKAGPCDASLRYAGDYKLWIDFARYASLVSFDFPVSCFRYHTANLSNEGNAYRTEMMHILPPGRTFLEWRVKVWSWLKNQIFS
jgi:glycosyltransferase involved in cell wall biosynthesis